MTGTWRSRNEGNIYHGAFQAVIDPRGETMQGKWIGFGRTNEINHGPWEFRLLTRKVDRPTKAKVFEEFRGREATAESTG